MKKCSKFVSTILLLAFVITVQTPVDIHAAVVNTCFPYTLGEQVEYAYTSMTEYHSFEVTKRSKVKVEISIPQEQEYKYSGSVNFYFKRKADGDIEDIADSKYYDYDEKITVERGANVEKEITLQPGKYYFVESQGSIYKFTYQFKISVLEQVDTPTYSGVTKNGNQYDVAYKIGTEFKAHNYQYERSTMYFYFTVPYRTQYDLSVGVKKDEYVTGYTYKNYDTVKIQRDNNSKYTPYTDVNSYIVNPGESIQKAVTLEAGKYRIEMKSNDGLRGDFSLKLSEGSIAATSIKFDKPTVTIERGQSTSVSATATPLNGTANIRYQSSNTKVATVSATGWVTGIKEGTATLTAYLQNGKKAICTIKIKEMKAVAEVVDQRKFYAYHNKNEVLLDFTPYKGTYRDATYISNLDIYRVKRTFKIYRSTKKNGNYKYLGQVSYKKTPGYAKFVDKKVKANTRYYYKVQVKVQGDGDFGALSKPMEYWTTPNPKVKIKSNTMSKASWKKVKGTTGYLVTEHCIQFAGYNIFGRRLNDSITASKLVKNTSFKKKYYDRAESGKKSKSDFSVTTYAKHGKYYYVSGRPVTKFKGDLEILKVNRIVG